ncbi:MAG: site-2 protease family protein [Nakamurella sp.]
MKRSHSGTWIFPAVCAATAIAAVLAHQATSPIGFWVFVTVLGGWIITLCLHEFAHAATALAGGDQSVRASGYLTLNPARYVDTSNSLVIPIVVLAIGGIPLPGGAVLVRPGSFRFRWWGSVVAAAGPVTNLLAGIVIAAVAAPFDSAMGAALSFLALLQFIAALLNLLPLPGFDGYGIVAPYLPRHVTAALARWGAWLPLAVFGVIFFVPGAMSALFDAGYGLLSLAGGSRISASVGASLFQFWR